jgi:hypothetical protein
MKPKTIYLLFCFAGLLLPYWQFVPWVATNGLNLQLMLQQLFANPISTFFATDVLVSSLVLLFFMRSEGIRLSVRRGLAAGCGSAHRGSFPGSAAVFVFA